MNSEQVAEKLRSDGFDSFVENGVVMSKGDEKTKKAMKKKLKEYGYNGSYGTRLH